MSYQNQSYYLSDCRDWSKVVTTGVAPVVPWPIANANMLQYSHFNGGFDDATQNKGLWHRFSSGPNINWQTGVSTTGGDAAYGSGTRYLAINCGAASCPAPGSQAIYQDIALSNFCNGCTYLYGVDARTEAGNGVLQIALAIVDNGIVVWQDVAGQTIKPDNGDPARNQAASVVRSSAFVSKVVTLPSFGNTNYSPNAYVRFMILPTSPNTFNIVDAFVNRLPTTTGSIAP